MRFICIMILYLLSSWGASSQDFICLYSKKPVIIDGKLNEWGNARSIIISDSKNRTESSAEVRILWDKNNLYMSYDVRDKNLQAEQYVLDHPHLWLDDMFEFLFDTRNDKDSCWNVDDVIYHINLLGQKKDDRGSADCTTCPKWNGSARYVIRMDGTLNDPTDIDKGYTVEIAVSWKELGIKPYPGFMMGADFALGDKGMAVFDWVGASPFRSPYAFGNLILQK